MAQIPTSTMSSKRLLFLGEYHITACNQTPSTAPIGAAFQAVQDELKARKANREAAELAMVAPRVILRFAEFRLEQRIRSVVFAAQAVDGRADGGPAKSALAPDGIDPIVRPRGAGQLTAAEAFLRRLVTQPECASLLAEHQPLLEADLGSFRDAQNARLLAATVLAEARAHEDGAREAWVGAYAGDVGAVQAIFKRRRSERDLYFDRFRASRLRDEEDDVGEDDDGEDEGGPPPA